MAAGAVFVLLGLLPAPWQGRAEVWAALACAALGFEQGLRLAEVPIWQQPLPWAVFALGLCLLAAARRLGGMAPAVWRGPLAQAGEALVGGAAATALAAALARQDRPSVQSLAGTLAVAGLALVVRGFDLRRRLGYLGAGLVELGYLVQLGVWQVREPQAFALPAGGLLLAIAVLEWRRGTGGRLKGALEAAALALLCGTSLAQALGFLGAGEGRYAYATFLLLEGLAIFGLGAALRWKRPFFVGAATVVADLGILLAAPLKTMNAWYLAGAIGLGMVALVVVVEQRRQRIGAWVDEWRQRLEVWE